jgi:hypothetical protein
MVNMKKITNIEAALGIFEISAVQHAQATELGDYKTANKAYKLIVNSIEFMQQTDKINELLNFISHSSVGVRIWSATYLLKSHEQIAIQELVKIASGVGIQSLNAEMTLIEWKKGNLKL